MMLFLARSTLTAERGDGVGYDMTTAYCKANTPTGVLSAAGLPDELAIYILAMNGKTSPLSPTER